MTVVTSKTDRDGETLRAARVGDEEAFRALTEPHRRALQVHCYRMLGSLTEAEDLVQETMLRAWRRLDTYSARASFGAWLYGIATNASLDALATRARRVLPQDVAPPDDPSAVPAAPLDVAWLQPYPDSLLDPVEMLERRETVRLAFIAAMQHLPPQQRAVLILRDVLDWPAKDVARLLGVTVASVNGSLRRARAAQPLAPAHDAPIDELVVARYVDAWNEQDLDTLVELLREEVELAMPPSPSWYRGRDAVLAFAAATFERFPNLWLEPARANATHALAVFAGGAPLAIKVLELDDAGIASITGFTDAALFSRFGLLQL